MRVELAHGATTVAFVRALLAPERETSERVETRHAYDAQRLDFVHDCGVDDAQRALEVEPSSGGGRDAWAR